jgi:hypothetical protein
MILMATELGLVGTVSGVSTNHRCRFPQPASTVQPTKTDGNTKWLR